MSTSYPTQPEWQRVTPAHPCAICGHGSWCCLSSDGAMAVCMRVSDGEIKATKNGGHLHRLHSTQTWPRQRVRTVHVPAQSPTRHDLEDLARRFQGNIDPARLDALAKQLGLTVESLQRLGIGWATKGEIEATGTKCRSCGCWTFPMIDAHGRVRGIRLRTDSGFKYAVNGSHDGLFIPTGLDAAGRLLIAEGPTDTAALLDLGFMAVGRSCCTGGTKLLVEFTRLHKVNDVVAVSDADPPGQRGAKALACVLAAYLPRVQVILPPSGLKDARGWKLAGASAADVQATIDAAPVWGVHHVG